MKPILPDAMRNMTSKLATVLLAVALATTGTASAALRTSTSYSVKAEVLNGGGQAAVSTNYQLLDSDLGSIGEASSSASYTSTPGFPGTADNGPIVQTQTATLVTSISATLNGTVNANGQNTTVRFEYGLTTGYGTSISVAGALSGSADSPVSVAISGLILNTTYHFRVVASNVNGDSYGSDLTFRTGTAAIPTVATGDPSGVSSNSATLVGAVNPQGSATQVYFEYGSSTLYGTTTTTQNLAAGTSIIDVTAGITGLTPNSTYHYRIVATNTGGTVFGNDVSFTATGSGGGGGGGPTDKPTVTTVAATGIGTRSATLQATINPNGGTTLASFDYGATTSYGTRTTSQSPGNGTSAVSFVTTVTDLQPGTTYHFRIVAANSLGESQGADLTLTTLFDPPTVSTDSADPGTTFATLTGTVNPNQVSTTVSFKYGQQSDLSDATTASVQGTLTGVLAQEVSVRLTNLVPQTTYYYQVVGSSSAGTSNGAILSFNTLAAQTPIPVDDHLYVGVKSVNANIVANDVNADNEQTGTTAGLIFDGIVDQPDNGSVAGGPVITFDPGAKFPINGTNFTYSVKTAANLNATGTVFVHTFAAYRNSFGGVISGSSENDGGSVTLELTLSGDFTGQLIWQNKLYSLRSALDPLGTVVVNKQKTGAAKGIELALSLRLQPSGLILGTLLDKETNNSSDFIMRGADLSTNAETGAYTAHIDQSLGNPAVAEGAPEAANGLRAGLSPQAVSGFGFTLAKISQLKNGKKAGRFSGRMPDSEPYANGSKLFADRFLLNSKLYPNRFKGRPVFNGSVFGETQFAGGATLVSLLEWIKNPLQKTIYPNGFRNSGVLLAGDRFLRPGETPALNFVSQFGTLIQVQLSEGDLTSPAAIQVQLTLRGSTLIPKVVQSDRPKTTFRVSPTTGFFSGSFQHTDVTLKKPVQFSGAFRRFAGTEKGKGGFKGVNTAGKVTVTKIQ